MISEALVFLQQELSRYILAHQSTVGGPSQDDLNPGDVMLGNISSLESDQDGRLKNKVLISLVNIEEESTLKNNKHYLKNPVTNSIEYQQPPVYLNLYVLFCATLAEPLTSDNYERALHRLSLIIAFFQAKKSFTIQNSPQSLAAFPVGTDEALLEELRLHPELYTLTFEQINHLWGSLGGKQVPFVMYKVRLVKVQVRFTLDAPLVEDIVGDTKDLVAPKMEAEQ